ncbi:MULTISPECIES: response regulator transcription factor [Tenacibaculum]|uniref:Response regulator transcription factor n=1 Tax=Tenacibaculum aiptasiae TaxID=426481 RepID=A0A7J5AQR7_9FLAO|nr:MULTISPECIES: response regulator transcription factor [Tenacibaculum]KAB1159764.1 response regulator transcription factor [Tenacibaculum aiptasiae]MCF2874073.1 response regulator transcription factor [Tenacibaculum sp. Cn5-1]MCF2934654.1 response regulator transcription factor [Tenacibaculum sp. Cn5-34]MCG7510864.1 response regulator transcription factor [Tenacibaculum sp. Cn5-46]
MKVYLVDDHPIVIEGYKAMMKAEGISVVGSSTDGFGLMEWLDNNYCDVLLLDISMPYYNGLDVLKHLNKKFPEIKTIMVTSICDGFTIQKVIELGAKGYVLKEESGDCIVEAIKTVYNGKLYFSEKSRDAVIDMNLESSSGLLLTDVLSSKEIEVMQFLVEGFTSDEISNKLGITRSAYRSSTERIRRKLDVKDNVQLALLAFKHVTNLFLKK